MSFRHTQELTGRRLIDSNIIPDEKEARHKFYDGVATNIRLLQGLVEHPAYKMFQAELSDEENAILNHMETCSGDQLAKVAGALLSVRSYRTWAEDRVVELAAVLQDRDDK